MSPEAFPTFFPVFFVGVWIAAIGLTARIGGWSSLAEKYRCTNQHFGSWKGWCWGKIGMANYKHCLWVATAPEGLYLKTGPAFLFRPFHPPLLIPWSAITSVEEQKYWWLNVFAITVQGCNVSIMIEKSALTDSQRFLGGKLKLLEARQ